MYDRKTKLEKARLDRLASEGIYIDLDSIRDEIKKTLEIQVELENALIEENASENLNCDREVESECETVLSSTDLTKLSMTSHFVSSSSNKSSVAMEDILFSFSSLPFDNVWVNIISFLLIGLCRINF
jgi:hypothetical protein